MCTGCADFLSWFLLVLIGRRASPLTCIVCTTILHGAVQAPSCFFSTIAVSRDAIRAKLKTNEREILYRLMNQHSTDFAVGILTPHIASVFDGGYQVDWG